MFERRINRKPSLLVVGRIPANMECPFARECLIKAAGNCNHTGKEHSIAYSCASARGFDLMHTTS